MSLLPKAMIRNLLAEVHAVASDKSKDTEERVKAMNYLADCRYAEDFFDDFIKIVIDAEDDNEPRYTAAIDLAWIHNKIRLKSGADANSEAIEKVRTAFIKLMRDYMRGATDCLNLAMHIMGDFRNSDPKVSLDQRSIESIADDLRDKSNKETYRDHVIYWCRTRLTAQDHEYFEFTNATIEIAEDTENGIDIRKSAMLTLDPVRHKDVLLALKRDTNVEIKRLAIQMLNHA